MKGKLFLLTLIVLTLLSCEGTDGQFRLKGQFAHLEQGEFLIYSPDGGLDRLDTLHIRNGEFDFTTPLSEEATYHILYPNFSELVIFGQSGKVAHIKGDAQNLNAVEVKGSEDNELYTNFRKEIEQQPDSTILELARNYIFEHPQLALARFLFRNYFLLSEKASRQQTIEVYDSLCRAMPDNVLLSRMADDVRSKEAIKIGQKMPDFKLKLRPNLFKENDTIPHTATLADYKGKYLLLAFWATWKSGSQAVLYRARRSHQEMGDTIQAISFSLDVSNQELTRIELNDSINYPSFCDFKCWNSPYIRQWGICDLPYYILIGPDQKIVAVGTDWVKDIEPKTEGLCL